MTDEEIQAIIRSMNGEDIQIANTASSVYTSSDNYFTVTVEAETNLPDSPQDPVIAEPVAENNQPFVNEAVRETTARFSGAVWYDKIQEQTVCVGGQGGISSWFTFLVARMHPKNIYTFDPDRVERVNLAGQLFRTSDVGLYKGEAIARTIKEYSEYRSVFTISERYVPDSMSANVMVCGFDNMVARKVFFHNWKTHVNSLPEEKRRECLFIDGRLAAESLQVYCIVGNNPWDISEYGRHCLFSDEEADETVCSLKQTAFMANIIGGIMANLFVNFCANLCGGCRTIPFLTQYEGDQMYLKLEGGV